MEIKKAIISFQEEDKTTPLRFFTEGSEQYCNKTISQFKVKEEREVDLRSIFSTSNFMTLFANSLRLCFNEVASLYSMIV